jgi:hypothetical protein
MYHKAERSTGGIEYSRDGEWHHWTGSELVFRPEEPLMPSWIYLARRLIVSAFDPNSSDHGHFHDWDGVAEWYADLASEASEPDDVVRATTQRLIDGMKSPAEKLAAIAIFIQSLRYVAVEFGEGKWRPRCASVTMHNRYGDCKDKTVLMQAMLNAAGLTSAPVLASLTLPVDTAFPNPLQFNHVLIGIPVAGLGNLEAYSDAIADAWLFFDPATTDINLGGLSTVLQGKTVLVCAGSNGRLVRLPLIPTARSYLRNYEVEAYLADDGSVSADIKVSDHGHEAAGVSIRRAETPIREQIESWKQRIYPSAPALAISNFQYAPDLDSGWVRFHADMPAYAAGTDSVRLLKLDFLHAAVPPELGPGRRLHPIELGPRGFATASIRWHLPQHWLAEAGDDSGAVGCEGGRLRYSLTHDSGTELRLQWEIEITGQRMDSSGYGYATDFSEAMSNLHGLSILLRRTVVPE